MRLLRNAVLSLLFILVFLACVATPTVMLVGERFTFADMIDHAEAIRIVDHGNDKHNGAKTLRKADFPRVLHAFPYSLDVGIPRVTDESRFEPDHEIKITDQRGDDTDLRLNFATSHFEIGDGPVFRIPYVWRGTLHWFFSHEMEEEKSK